MTVVPVMVLPLAPQLSYTHDGSHTEHYRGWGRMLGEVTHVYDPPQVRQTLDSTEAWQSYARH